MQRSFITCKLANAISGSTIQNSGTCGYYWCVHIKKVILMKKTSTLEVGSRREICVFISFSVQI
jgi:hypothetical protein